jgi:EAL domain-containing protein (putative c-di-GMP-specific phosphodiesterase class I)/AmiR/NasT family two-component response regulator
MAQRTLFAEMKIWDVLKCAAAADDAAAEVDTSNTVPGPTGLDSFRALVGIGIAQRFPRLREAAPMKEQETRVLIVDDDREIRSVLHDFLSSWYDCTAVNSASDALAALAGGSFDLIMSDISMPQMSGLEMIPHIVALAPESVVVMISGQRMIESAIEAMRAGAFDYITKPFELAQVGAVVRRALGHRDRLASLRSLANRRDADQQRLLRALDHHDFVVHYQPQVEIQSRTIVGAEALVRWEDPEQGMLLPADFIPLAEDTGLIVPIGTSVLRTACAQARQWHDMGLADSCLAVNVSPRQLQEENFVETVAEILNDAGLEPGFLEIEVTETSLMQNPEVGIKTLTELREMGVRVAIDDFGTGYSSLGYLKRLPIDSVKLDASFVRDATSDPDDAALVMAIITLAHNLRLKVIAEGIETEDQLAFLRLLRCDRGQGYLLGRPATSDEMISAHANNPLLLSPARAF